MEEKWTTVIEPQKRNFLCEVKEIWGYRQLIQMFIKRDLKTMYAQTILGPLWFILNAILSSSVMTIVFGKIIGISVNGIPNFLFYMSGNIIWNNFSSCVLAVSNTFLGNVRLMGKVWFPRICVPIATIFSKQFRFIIEFMLFSLFYLCYIGVGDFAWRYFLIIPLIWLETIALALGCGMLICSVTIRYRDLSVIIGVFLQIWMYLTPVVYPLSQIPEKWQFVFLLNPMAVVIECFRSVFFGGVISVQELIISNLITMLVLIVGINVFQHAQASFLDTI